PTSRSPALNVPTTDHTSLSRLIVQVSFRPPEVPSQLPSSSSPCSARAPPVHAARTVVTIRKVKNRAFPIASLLLAGGGLRHSPQSGRFRCPKTHSIRSSRAQHEGSSC